MGTSGHVWSGRHDQNWENLGNTIWLLTGTGSSRVLERDLIGQKRQPTWMRTNNKGTSAGPVLHEMGAGKEFRQGLLGVQ